MHYIQNFTVEEKLHTNRVIQSAVEIGTVSSGTTNITNSTKSFINVTGTASNFSLKFADATTLTLNSVFEIHNSATTNVNVLNNSNAVLCTLKAGHAVKINLINNSTAAGSFSVTYYLSVDQADALEALKQVPLDTLEPTGFVNRTDSVLSFNSGTRTFSIAPVSTSFSYYIKGKKITISTTLSTVIDDVSQITFIYLDENGTLQKTNTFDLALLTEYAYVANLIWDADADQLIMFGEERHGIVMDAATHGYLHTTRGSQLATGGALDVTLGGSTSSNDSAQVGLTNMTLVDEDIRMNITHAASPSLPFQQYLTKPAKIPLYYRSGASGTWKKLTTTDYPINFGTNRARYNQFSGGSWVLTEATELYYLTTFIFATNNINEPVIGILGQAEYLTQSDAEANASWNSIDFGMFPAQEFKLLYRIIYRTSNTYTNAVRSVIHVASDYRYGVDREVSTIPQLTDHGNLSGLADDDHLQYLPLSGARSMTGALNMGGQQITNVGNVDGVDISAHAARHLPNGADPLTTGTPVATGTANSAGTANTFSRSDHVHNTVITRYGSRTNTGSTTTTAAAGSALLTITNPIAGTYMLYASIIANHGSNNGQLGGFIYLGGSEVTVTRANLARGNTSSSLTYAVSLEVTVNGSQSVELRWNTNAGTLTNLLASLSLVKVT